MCNNALAISGLNVTPPWARARRRGIASVVAMLYLVLFSALAVGFYAATTTAAQISRNERMMGESQYAAESGLQFLRYQLGRVDLPTNTTNDTLLSATASELGRLLNGQTNMGTRTVQVTSGAIAIPSASTYIPLDAAGRIRFRATVTQSGSFLIATVVGQSADRNISRTIRLKFQKAPRASAIFNYGIASRGKIVTAGASRIVGQGDPTRGSVLSTNMTEATPIVIGGKEVSGDLSITNPFGQVSFAGAKIGGTNDTAAIARDHIHKGVTEPDFPEVDVSEYAKYAVNKYVEGKTLDNAYIPAGMNPSFTGGADITGVLYIKAPNKVSFGGNVNIRGVIVVENGAAYNLANNMIDMTGNVTAYGVETLPPSYGALRKLTGAFILAPNFSVSFTGSFGTVSGSIIASEVNFGGNAGGVIKGSIINLHDTRMDVNGSSEIIIASTGTSNYPTGVTFGNKFAPLPDTYAELP